MKKHEILAALQAAGIAATEANTLAELRAMAAEAGIDVTVPSEVPPLPADAPQKERIVWFRVGKETLRAASGVCAPRSRVRMKESDATLHESRGKGEILGYAN